MTNWKSLRQEGGPHCCGELHGLPLTWPPHRAHIPELLLPGMDPCLCQAAELSQPGPRHRLLLRKLSWHKHSSPGLEHTAGICQWCCCQEHFKLLHFGFQLPKTAAQGLPEPAPLPSLPSHTHCQHQHTTSGYRGRKILVSIPRNLKVDLHKLILSKLAGYCWQGGKTALTNQRASSYR